MLESAQEELRLWQRLHGLATQCKDGRDIDKILRCALRLGIDFFHSDAGCVVMRRPGRTVVELHFSSPRDHVWDLNLLSAFLRGDEDVAVPEDQMYARLRRNGRMWGLLALNGKGRSFPWDARRAFSSIGNMAAELMERADESRVREVRTRIDRRILEQLRPNDLFYQILHGIRSLTGYDHSAALLIRDDQTSSLEVVAEQIAWCKAKSQRIGLKLPLGEGNQSLLTSGPWHGFNRIDGQWCNWSGSGAEELARLLDYNDHDPRENTNTIESALLCAPLITRDGVLGLLKVAACHPGTFGRHDADLITGFLVQASVAMQNLKRTESLEHQVIAAERKHAVANLARGVSHDINNALGAVFPLVQQLRADLEAGELDAETATEDLRQIERSLQLCRRVFGGMLNFARGMAHSSTDVVLRYEIDCTLAILKDRLQRSQIQVIVDVPTDLPTIRGFRANVEQLLLNLLSNAHDAMPDGGTLTMRARHNAESIELFVEDTGCGIPAAILAKVQEPFFTTKQSGSGLGLAICRSIVSELGGTMRIESLRQQGTSVHVVFPRRVEEKSP
jgi:signal transduction histidine kinase